jgi:hypothetical protein
VTTQEIEAIQQGGKVWLDAAALIAALRDRAERYSTMADEEPVEGYTQETYRSSCWAAAAALIDRADALDLECIARVNE